MRGATWSLVGSVMARGFVFAAAVAAGRLLGVAEFGHLAIVQTTVEVALIAGNLGLAVTATRFVATHRATPQTAGRYVGVVLIGSAVCGAVVAAILFLTASFIATQALGTPLLETPLRWAAPIVLVGSVNLTLLAVLTGLESFGTAAALSALRGGLSAGLLVAGIALGGVGGGVAGWAIGEALSFPVLMHVTRRSCHSRGIQIRFRELSQQWPVLRQFGLPSALGGALVFGAAWVSRAILVASPEGFTELGLFSAAFRWTAVLLFIPLAAGSIFTPVLAHSFGRGDTELFRRLFIWHLVLGLVAVSLPSLVVVGAADRLMGAFGSDYVQGSTVLMILALSAIPTTLNSIVGQALIGAGLIWWRFCFDLVIAVALVGLALLLVPTMQAMGLAIAYGGAFTAVSIAMIAFVLIRWPNTLLPGGGPSTIVLDTEAVG